MASWWLDLILGTRVLVDTVVKNPFYRRTSHIRVSAYSRVCLCKREVLTVPYLSVFDIHQLCTRCGTFELLGPATSLVVFEPSTNERASEAWNLHLSVRQ